MSLATCSCLEGWEMAQLPSLQVVHHTHATEPSMCTIIFQITIKVPAKRMLKYYRDLECALPGQMDGEEARDVSPAFDVFGTGLAEQSAAGWGTSSGSPHARL